MANTKKRINKTKRRKNNRYTKRGGMTQREVHNVVMDLKYGLNTQSSSFKGYVDPDDGGTCGFKEKNMKKLQFKKKPRNRQSCESDKWKQRGCYWLEPANACYDVNERMKWKEMETMGLEKENKNKIKRGTTKKMIKEAKKQRNKAKRSLGLSDILSSELRKSFRSLSSSKSKSKSRSSSRS